MSEHNPWCRGNRPRSPRERVERDRILYGTGILRVFPWGAEARIPPDEVYIHSNLPAPGSDALAAAHAEITRLQSRIRRLESAGGIVGDLLDSIAAFDAATQPPPDAPADMGGRYFSRAAEDAADALFVVAAGVRSRLVSASGEGE